MRLVARRLMSTTELSAACAKPWPTPDVKLSPKTMTEEDTRFVMSQVSKFGGEGPIDKATMPPSSWYLTDAFCKAEAKAVFGTTWQFACRADQVAAPGQYVSSYVGAGEPVIVVRGEDGQVGERDAMHWSTFFLFFFFFLLLRSCERLPTCVGTMRRGWQRAAARRRSLCVRTTRGPTT